MRAAWDPHRLYFAFVVSDSSVVCVPDTIGAWLGDCIEVFLDTRHDRTSIRMRDDYQLLIKPQGEISCLNNEPRSALADSTWAQRCGVEFAQQIEPAGYTIEVGIPWQALKLQPFADLTLGFDIFNTDLDQAEGKRIGYSLAGNERYNNNNPSSWATLRLEGRGSAWLPSVLIGLVISLSILGVLAAIRRRRPAGAATPAISPAVERIESRLILDAKTFIRENLTDENLRVTMVAEALKVNSQYLSRKFNREARQSFTDFVNGLRVEEAKRMLVQGQLAASEVAFAVGFGSANNFGMVFKRLTGKAPKAFRNESRPSEAPPAVHPPD